MKYYLGVTDIHWYTYLSHQNRDDVNFWQPGGLLTFRALSPGQPFLFKLKSPINRIAGVGFFSSYTSLPLSMAWDVFDAGNGCESLTELQRMIIPLRKDTNDLNPKIGCIVLTNPIFFSQEDWLEVPEDWKPSIQQGKTYATDNEIGRRTWQKIEQLVQKYLSTTPVAKENQVSIREPNTPYGNSILVKIRLGQGAFRILVTDAYSRKCAISGEKTLPVLEAAHIKPYSKSGRHLISNSILLRSDIHKLFDSGYITITPDLKVEISKKIKEEFENGREYYRFHGADIYNLPADLKNRPETEFVQWHNENIFKG